MVAVWGEGQGRDWERDIKKKRNKGKNMKTRIFKDFGMRKGIFPKIYLIFIGEVSGSNFFKRLTETVDLIIL